MPNNALQPTPLAALGAAERGRYALVNRLESGLKHIVLVIFFILGHSVLSAQADDDFVLVQSDDAKMKAAFKKAKSSLSNFLRLVDMGRNKDSIYGAYVRIEDKGNTEYLWVTDVQKYNEAYYIGYVISAPRLVKNVKNGATIGFKVEDIFDWQHYDKTKNITYGGFTTCALMNPSSQEDSEYIKKYGMQCSAQ
jgi:uncharacterized protein YegJ (DUF2314 family)